ncbi:MAG: V-type ATPase subunit [Elusimicrobiota bacterium]|nr:V-type ATPase subunit [Elusimicrobiota bacterium]
MQTATSQSSDYLSLVGKVCVYETGLFDRGVFHRLIDSGSLLKFTKELSDTKYRRAVESMKEGNHFISACKGYIYAQYFHFRSKLHDSKFLDIFMLENDISNFVNFARGAECNESYCRGISGINWAEAENLEGFFRDAAENLSKIEPAAALEDFSYSLVEKVCMDMVTDRFLENISSRAIKAYRRYYIDTKNLLTKANNPEGEIYLKGGNFEPGYWESVDIAGGIPRRLKLQPYMKNIRSSKDRTLWEPEIRRFLSGFLKDMRKNTFGPEAIIAYILTLTEEVTNLNLIYTGLGMGLEKDIMKENLNLSYV